MKVFSVSLARYSSAGVELQKRTLLVEARKEREAAREARRVWPGLVEVVREVGS